MTVAAVRPMPEDDVAAWQAARASAGSPLPEPFGQDRHEAVTVEVDGVDVGGALLALSHEGGAVRCVVRELQTTLPHEAAGTWTAVATALGDHARARGAVSLATAVAPALASAFGAAGFQATMVGASRAFGSDGWSELADDGRLTLRPMDLPERHRFVEEVRALMHAGMARAGVAEAGASSLDDLETRLAGLLTDPAPEREMLLTALVENRPAGSAWATLMRSDDGTLEFYGHSMHLFPEFRGQGLGRSFLGALNAHVRTLGINDVHVRVYGFDQWVRGYFLTDVTTVDDVHLRKDLHPH